MKKTLLLIPYTILIFSIFWFITNHSDKILEVWDNLSLLDITALIILQWFSVFLLSYPSFVLLRIHDKYISLFDMSFLSYACNLVNHLVPYRPGVALRWWYLTKQYPITNSLFFSVMSVYFIWLVLAALTVLVASAAFLSIPLEMIFQEIKFLILSLMITSLLMLLLWTKIRHYSFFNNIEQTLSLINVSNTLRLVGSTILLYLLMGLALQLCFDKVGHSIDFPASLFFLCTLKLTSIVQITPGNAGIAEVAIGALTQWLYQDFTIGFSAIALFRITQLSASGILTFFLAPYAYKLKKIVTS